MGVEALPLSEAVPMKRQANPSAVTRPGPTLEDVRSELGDVSGANFTEHDEPLFLARGTRTPN